MAEREKSALYPAVTLEECIDFITVISSFNSKTVAYKAVAEKYGLSSITTKSFTQRIGSSKQYGLITTSNSTIQLTDLAKRILYPVTDGVEDLKHESFSLPPLYAALINEYEGKAIPTESILANLLMGKYKISKAAKDIAARVFIQNANELGYIHAGVFSCERTNDGLSESTNDVEAKSLNDNDLNMDIAMNNTLSVQNSSDKGSHMSDYITQTYPVESGKVARISIPIDATEDDLLAIRDLLEVIMKRKFKIKVHG